MLGRVLARHDFLEEYARVEPANGTVNGSVVLTDNNLKASPSATQAIPLTGMAIQAPPTVSISNTLQRSPRHELYAVHRE